MGQPTKQEIQSLLDQTKNRIMEKMMTRQDVQTITEASRDRVMTYIHDLVQIHQQNVLRRQDVQNSQLTKRIAVLETRMISMETELKLTRQVLERLANQQPTQHVEAPKQSSTPPEQLYSRYLYQTE